MAKQSTDLTTREPVSEGQASPHARPGEGPSLFGLIRKNWQAHLTEGATDAELRMLACQLRVIEGRRAVAEAELNARISLADLERTANVRELEGRRQAAELERQAEEAEAERALLASVRQASPEQARRIIGADLETQRLLLEREQLRRERMGLPPAAPPAALALPAPGRPGPAALEVHVSDRQVETLALRALTRFAALPPGEAERRWDEWRRELHLRLPPYAAAQVERRVEELRELSG